MSTRYAILANSFLASRPVTYVPRGPQPINPTESAELACAPRADCGFTMESPRAAAPEFRKKSRRLVFWLIDGLIIYSCRVEHARSRFCIHSVKLSILMPVYNERTVVERCISLVLAAPLPEN